ncbi:MAG: helix-turn-helix transcriptional regulator, partial [Clostridia bacterium]
NMDINEKVGGNIRATRILGNMSIEEFSLRLNLPLNRVNEIEEGKEDIHLDLLFEIADVLEVTPGFLINDNPVLM